MEPRHLKLFFICLLVNLPALTVQSGLADSWASIQRFEPSSSSAAKSLKPRFWNDDLEPCIMKYCLRHQMETRLYMKCIRRHCPSGLVTVPRDLEAQTHETASDSYSCFSTSGNSVSNSRRSQSGGGGGSRRFSALEDGGDWSLQEQQEEDGTTISRSVLTAGRGNNKVNCVCAKLFCGYLSDGMLRDECSRTTCSLTSTSSLSAGTGNSYNLISGGGGNENNNKNDNPSATFWKWLAARAHGFAPSNTIANVLVAAGSQSEKETGSNSALRRGLTSSSDFCGMVLCAGRHGADLIGCVEARCDAPGRQISMTSVNNRRNAINNANSYKSRRQHVQHESSLDLRSRSVMEVAPISVQPNQQRRSEEEEEEEDEDHERRRQSVIGSNFLNERGDEYAGRGAAVNNHRNDDGDEVGPAEAERTLIRKRRINDEVSQCIQSYCGRQGSRQSRLACIVKSCHRVG